MTIDWTIVAMIAAPLIAGVAGAALNHWLEGRPRLISYIGHVSAHRIPQETGNPIDINTHSVVLRNTGRKPSRNVRLTHRTLPNFTVSPTSVDFRIESLPSGDTNLVIPVLVPQTEVTISYLYSEPLRAVDVHGDVQSDEGQAKILNVLLTTQYPAWVTRIATWLIVFGAIALLYAFFEFAVFLVELIAALRAIAPAP